MAKLIRLWWHCAIHSPLRDCQPVHQHFATKPLHAYSLVPRPFPTRPWRRSHAVNVTIWKSLDKYKKGLEIHCLPPPRLSTYIPLCLSWTWISIWHTFFELSFCTMFVFMCEWVELYEVFLVICCPRTWDCNVQRTVSNYTVCCSVDSRLINARFELQRSGNAPISLPSVYVTSFMW